MGSEESKTDRDEDGIEQEEGLLRLIEVNVATLDEFKTILQSLLPSKGQPIKSLEVYIGSLTAAQLAYLFEILADNPSDSLENILFWQVSFPVSQSIELEQQVERASQHLKKLKTLMVYSCRFPNEPTR